MKKQFREWLKEKLKHLRLDKGEKAADLAVRCGMKAKTYAAIEEGRSLPNVFGLKRICTELGTTLDEFMKDAPEGKEVLTELEETT